MPAQPNHHPKDDPSGLHLQPTTSVPAEPTYAGGQDSDALDDARVLSLTTAGHVAGRGPLQAAVWARGESEHSTQNWKGECGKFVRCALDIPPRDPSAIAMWFGADPDSRHPLLDPNKAPDGHPFCWSGGEFGHIGYMAWPFPDHVPGSWQTDLVRVGFVDKVLRTAPQTHWGKVPLGYLDELNGYDLKTGKPKDSKPYLALERAAHNIGVALDTAKHEHDAHDVAVLTRHLQRMEKLAHQLKHS